MLVTLPPERFDLVFVSAGVNDVTGLRRLPTWLREMEALLDALRELDRTVDDGALRDHLAMFLFVGDEVEKPVTDLSGGEKQRLALARMTRAQFDLLCMDEPTNHLDVAGTEGLEQALKEFPGTVVLITHDRQLVEEVADRVLWVEGGAVRTFDQGLEFCIIWQ